MNDYIFVERFVYVRQSVLNDCLFVLLYRLNNCLTFDCRTITIFQRKTLQKKGKNMRFFSIVLTALSGYYAAHITLDPFYTDRTIIALFWVLVAICLCLVYVSFNEKNER